MDIEARHPADRRPCKAPRSVCQGRARPGHRFFAILVWVGLLLGGAAYAAGFGTPYTWHEGGRAHRVWMDPGLIAEMGVSTGGSTASTAPHGLIGFHRVSSPWRGVRLWRIPAGSEPRAVVDRLNAATNAGSAATFVPVFRDAPDPRAPMRLLGHEMLASLPAHWSRVEVRAWAARNDLAIVRRMPIGSDLYLLRSPLGGVALLQLVDRIRRAGIVRDVYPNWRRALALR